TADAGEPGDGGGPSPGRETGSLLRLIRERLHRLLPVLQRGLRALEEPAVIGSRQLRTRRERLDLPERDVAEAVRLRRTAGIDDLRPGLDEPLAQLRALPDVVVHH